MLLHRLLSFSQHHHHSIHCMFLFYITTWCVLLLWNDEDWMREDWGRMRSSHNYLFHCVVFLEYFFSIVTILGCNSEFFIFFFLNFTLCTLHQLMITGVHLPDGNRRVVRTGCRVMYGRRMKWEGGGEEFIQREEDLFHLNSVQSGRERDMFNKGMEGNFWTEGERGGNTKNENEMDDHDIKRDGEREQKRKLKNESDPWLNWL